jgi:hypothetical protein
VPATENTSIGAVDVLDGAFEQMRSRSDHPFLEEPRRQGRAAAGENGAAARISSGAVRDNGAVSLQDLNIVDSGAELVGDHLGERGLEALAVRGNPKTAGHRPR